LRCTVEQKKWVLWLHDLWRLEGGAAQVKGASNPQKQIGRATKTGGLLKTQLVQYTSEL